VTTAARAKGLLKQVVVLLLVGGVAIFFWRAIDRNWAEIRKHHFELSYPLLAVSLSAVITASLLGTYAWQLTLNTLSGRRDMTFRRSVATMHSTSLTKYLPGKFWSYALQMYWLSRSGYPKALVLYVNLINLAVALLTGVLLALLLLLGAGTSQWLVVSVALLLVLLADVLCILYYAPIFKLVSRWATRLTKRDIGYFDISPGLMLRVHGVQFLAQVVSAVGGYLACFGVGYRLDASSFLLVMASLLLADVAGFVFFLVPGGLGVREAVMYLILKGAPVSSLSLVLPLVTRASYMLGDVLLGLAAFVLLRSLVDKAQASDVSPG
jgi:glycosyltransferase 2 family protein